MLGVRARPKVKTGERIARHVADLVANGTLLPGDQLPAEPELIEQLGVSRGSAQEGLRLLEATGVVDVRAGRNGGAFIAQSKDEPRNSEAARTPITSRLITGSRCR